MNIVLIGMPGSGKTSIGKKLAVNLNYAFIDVDDLIKRKTQMELQAYIDKFGDEAFLKIEEKTVLDLHVQNCVISPGGSIVYSQEAIHHLKRNSLILFLDASFETLKTRISDVERRGIVFLRRKSYKELFSERRSLYQKYSDRILKIDGLTVEQVIDKITESLNQSQSRTHSKGDS